MAQSVIDRVKKEFIMEQTKQMQQMQQLVTEPSFIMKNLAKKRLRENRWQVYLVLAIFVILAVGGSRLLTSQFPMDIAMKPFGYKLPGPSPIGQLYALLTIPLGAGVISYSIHLIRNGESKLSKIVDGYRGFGIFIKVIAVYLIDVILIGLGLLLLIVPGIIIAFRLSQSTFILMDNPEKGVFECISDSWYLMRGNCMKYFLLGLSFLPLVLLCVLAAGGVAGILASVLSLKETYVIILSLLIGGIAGITIGSYVQLTMAVFYELLSGHLVIDHITGQTIR